MAVGFFSWFAWQVFPCKGIFDFIIFLDAAKHFVDADVLYDRGSTYAPGLNVYKFPPLFAALLVQGIRTGFGNPDFFTLAYAMHVVLYVLAVVLLSMQWHARTIRLDVFVICFSTGLVFYPLLDDNILCLQLEVYIFFLLSLTYSLYFMRHDFLAGLALSFAAMLKIYPAVLLLFFLVLRKWGVIKGFIFGVILSVAYCVFVLNVEEVFYFVFHVFPVLLRELPAPGSAYNIALPAMVSLAVAGAYIFYLFGTLDDQTILDRLANNGDMDMDTLMIVISGISATAKVTSVVLLAAFLFFVDRMRKLYIGKNSSPSGLGVAVLFGAMVNFMVTGMQNAWTNYQVHLLIPVLILLACFLRIPSTKCRNLRFQAGVGIACLWFFALLDSAQMHVEQFPPEMVPGIYEWLVRNFSIVIPFTVPLGRCLAALLIFYASVRLAILEARVQISH